MSANELENLMSQLQVHGQHQDLNDHMLLGDPVPMKSTSGYYWRYVNQQNIWRNGKPRKHKLPDDYDPEVYFTNGRKRPIGPDGKVIPHKIYIPKHNDWLEDWEQNLIPKFVVPVDPKTREIAWDKVDMALLKKMWMHEYNFKRHYEKLYSIMAQKGNHPNTNAPGTLKPKVYPSMVTNGSVKPRQAKTSAQDKAKFRSEGKTHF